jgi:hypothetical protein
MMILFAACSLRYASIEGKTESEKIMAFLCFVGLRPTHRLQFPSNQSFAVSSQIMNHLPALQVCVRSLCWTFRGKKKKEPRSVVPFFFDSNSILSG